VTIQVPKTVMEDVEITYQVPAMESRTHTLQRPKTVMYPPSHFLPCPPPSPPGPRFALHVREARDTLSGCGPLYPLGSCGGRFSWTRAVCLSGVRRVVTRSVLEGTGRRHAGPPCNTEEAPRVAVAILCTIQDNLGAI
jgi:hypothetical protein